MCKRATRKQKQKLKVSRSSEVKSTCHGARLSVELGEMIGEFKSWRKGWFANRSRELWVVSAAGSMGLGIVLICSRKGKVGSQAAGGALICALTPAHVHSRLALSTRSLPHRANTVVLSRSPPIARAWKEVASPKPSLKARGPLKFGSLPRTGDTQHADVTRVSTRHFVFYQICSFCTQNGRLRCTRLDRLAWDAACRPHARGTGFALPCLQGLLQLAHDYLMQPHILLHMHPALSVSRRQMSVVSGTRSGIQAAGELGITRSCRCLCQISQCDSGVCQDPGRC